MLITCLLFFTISICVIIIFYVTVWLSYQQRFNFPDEPLPPVWHSVLPLASACVCVCVFMCVSAVTSTQRAHFLVFFATHFSCELISVAKTNQRETSHLSSQINFTPLSAFGTIINFTCALTHPGWGTSSYRGDVFILFHFMSFIFYFLLHLLKVNTFLTGESTLKRIAV